MFNLPFSQMPLERHSRLRAKPEFVANGLANNAKVLLFYKDMLIASQHHDGLLWFNYDELKPQLAHTPHLYLGEQNNQHYFAYELAQSELANSYFSHTHSDDFRKQISTLSSAEIAISGYAKTLLHWHKTHVFCGRCASQNRSAEGGYARRCSNSKCNHLTFPRHDPAVIMIVTKRFSDGVERCLLGRQASWPQGNYSALAGFVDAGETLEEAVIREVKEESGVDVERVEYIASQPWPFPSSVMIGFIAHASSEAINIGEDELEDARWFSRADLTTFGEWGDGPEQFKKPRHSSISRFLLDYWQNQRGELE
jgi:NAD+ diphosphatase